jgi:hypothetical protein
MTSSSDNQRCEHREVVAAYALSALERSEAELMKAHLPTCAECQQEYRALSSVTVTLSAWRAQSLPPSNPLWSQLVERIANPPE